MIRIYGVKTQLDPVKPALSETIHGCLIDRLGMPHGKRAHRFIGLDADSYFIPDGRSERYTVIEINMMAGRSPAVRRAWIKVLFERIESNVGDRTG